MKNIDLTNDNDSVVKSLFRLAGPIVFANFLQTAYQLTDTFWVGRLGASEVAALSLCFPILFFVLSLGGGFGVSGTILVSQYAGKKNNEMVSKICFQTFVVIVVTSLILSLISYFGISYVINSMTHNHQIANLSISYLKISLVGMIFSYLYLMFQSLYRGVGDVKTPFYIVLFTVVLNFFLDPIFIMGYFGFPKLGVDGAAYATVLTQGLSAIWGLYLLAKGRGGIKLDFFNTKIDFKEIKRILSIGLPASAEQSARSLAMLILTFLVSSFGDIVLASYGIGVRVLSFILIPSLGFSMSTSTIVGQNIGAQKYDRARYIAKVALGIIFVALTLAGIIFFIFAEEVVRVFVPGEIQIIHEGARFVKIIALSFGFVGLQQVAAGAFRGGGNTLIAMVIAIVSLWVFRFPFAYIFSHHTQMARDGIYYSFVFSNIFGAVISMIVFFRGTWIKNLVNAEEEIEKKTIETSLEEDQCLL